MYRLLQHLVEDLASVPGDGPSPYVESGRGVRDLYDRVREDQAGTG